MTVGNGYAPSGRAGTTVRPAVGGSATPSVMGSRGTRSGGCAGEETWQPGSSGERHVRAGGTGCREAGGGAVGRAEGAWSCHAWLIS